MQYKRLEVESVQVAVAAHGLAGHDLEINIATPMIRSTVAETW